MESFESKDGTEYHIGKVEKISIGDDAVEIITDSELFVLSLSNFRDPKYLEKIKKRDEIIYASSGIGIKKIFLLSYEMEFGVKEQN